MYDNRLNYSWNTSMYLLETTYVWNNVFYESAVAGPMTLKDLLTQIHCTHDFAYNQQ